MNIYVIILVLPKTEPPSKTELPFDIKCFLSEEATKTFVKERILSLTKNCKWISQDSINNEFLSSNNIEKYINSYNEITKLTSLSGIVLNLYIIKAEGHILE